MKLPFPSKKVLPQKDAAEKVRQWQAKGEKVVFSNGCFDLLHPGHVDLLYRAAEWGQRLVIGLNSNDSVKQLEKGGDRPIQDEGARAVLLAALEMVDLVVLFEEETPLELIKTLNPDILVKGADYQETEVVGKAFVEGQGGKVVLLSLLEGYSSTALIRQIQESG